MHCYLGWRVGTVDETQRCILYLDESMIYAKEEREVTRERTALDASEVGT